MLINEKQKQFLHLRVAEGKSLQSISNELDVPVHILKEWTVTLMEYLEEERLNEMDKIAEESQTHDLPHFRYLSEMYVRLKKELDKRDFSGLPTDKLYYIFNHVHMELKQQMLGEGFEDPYDFLDEDDYLE